MKIQFIEVKKLEPASSSCFIHFFNTMLVAAAYFCQVRCLTSMWVVLTCALVLQKSPSRLRKGSERKLNGEWCNMNIKTFDRWNDCRLWLCRRIRFCPFNAGAAHRWVTKEALRRREVEKKPAQIEIGTRNHNFLHLHPLHWSTGTAFWGTRTRLHIHIRLVFFLFYEPANLVGWEVGTTGTGTKF